MMGTISKLMAGAAIALGIRSENSDISVGKTRTPSLGGDVGKFHGREPFVAWWEGLKGAPSRLVKGMQSIPQWRWPDKHLYGQAKDGSIRHRTQQTPFRVRRWRKRAAARIVKDEGCTFSHAKEIVKGIESGMVRDILANRS